MPSTTPQDRKPKKKSTTKKPTAQPIEQPADPTGKYAPDAWLSGGIGSTEELTVPSGQLCLVRRPGLEGLMKAGVLHNVDSLSQIVNEKHIKRVEGKASEQQQIDIKSILDDPKALDEIIYVVDKVVCHCVVQPTVHSTPNDVTRRKQGVVYADMIDLADKMFIFNFVVGGTRDLERFRDELDESVGGLETGAGVPDEAE